MTKHFRKEHPTESLDQDLEYEYTDAEPSDEEPSLEQDDEETPDSMEHLVGGIKSEGSSNPAASNYNANLWRLPAQTAQTSSPSQAQFGPDVQRVKMERSLSRTPQRTPADPPLNHGMAYATTHRANTMPMSRSPSGDIMWQAQSLNESPTSMTAPQNYPMHGMEVPTSAPNQFQHQTIPLNRAIHDIILDDPQQPAYTQAPQQQQTYAPMPTAQYVPPNHDFRDEMPATPAPGQQVPQYPASLETAAPYQPPQALPMEEYNPPVNGMYGPPQVQAVFSYENYMDPWKDVKLEDPLSQMPEPVRPWN